MGGGRVFRNIHKGPMDKKGHKGTGIRGGRWGWLG